MLAVERHLEIAAVWGTFLDNGVKPGPTIVLRKTRKPKLTLRVGLPTVDEVRSSAPLST